MAEFPSHLKYTEEHEWVEVGDDGIVTVGITDFAQSELGDIVYVELPQEGDELGQTETFGTIEAVKTVEDLYAPVSGAVVEVNHELQDTPTLINTSPYDEGWLVRIQVKDENEIEKLLNVEQYKDSIGE